MIDLHLHLDGSLPLGFVKELAGARHIPLPEPVEAALQVPERCASLHEYLCCFDLSLALLQSAEALERAAFALCGELAQQGLLYAEIRFAPQLHGREGLSQPQAVEAVLAGVRRSGFHAQAILCCMRGGEEAANRETVAVTERYLGQGVCACDLAGAEALYPTGRYGGLFSYARSLGVPFTIHAGEAAGPDSIRAALDMGARRIGHGVRAGEDQALVGRLKAQKVPLELCFTSNLQTKAVASPQAFPLRAYLQAGLCCTVNTDNMTVSGTTLPGEFAKLQALGLTGAEREQLLLHACAAAFLPDAGRWRLAGQVKARIAAGG